MLGEMLHMHTYSLAGRKYLHLRIYFKLSQTERGCLLTELIGRLYCLRGFEVSRANPQQAPC